MSQDMQASDPVPHSDGPSGFSVRQEIPVSAAISHDMKHLGQEHEDMNNSQYGRGEIEMMFNDEFFNNFAEMENGAHVENDEMNTAGQQGFAVMPESQGDNTMPVSSENNCSMVPMDEGSSRLNHSDEGAKNLHGAAAVKREPEVEGKNRCQDLSFDHLVGEPGHHDEVHSSTLQHTSEISEDAPRDTMMNDESECQGHGFTDHTGLGEGEYKAEVHTRQDEHGNTVPTNEDFNWSEGPAATETDVEKKSQYAVLRKNHKCVQSEQQWGELMAPGITDQLLCPRGSEIDQPSTFTQTIDSWHDQGTMQSEYEENMMSMTGEEAVGQHTQQSNTRLSGLWPTVGMNQIHRHRHHPFGGSTHFTNTSASPHPSVRNNTTFTASDNFPQFQSPIQHFPQQQQLNPFNQSAVNAPFADQQQQLQAQVEEKRRQLENERRVHEQSQRQAQQVNSLSFAQNQASVPAAFLMGPLSYQRAPQSGYRQLPSESNNASHWPQMQLGSSQSQMGLKERPASYPVIGEEAVGKSVSSNRQTPGPSATPDQSKTQQQDLRKETNDDKTLTTGPKRHPSITSQTSATHNASTPQLSDLPSTTPASSTFIDWKLPQYDIQIEPTPTDPSQPSAKISLPGLVREELLLSPDHADQEIHLLVNVFLPGQRALTTPEPEPATAILNFHMIALMVIEAYVQYEIGDELGRRNPCYAPSNEDFVGTGKEQEYERIRDARSADVDDIFFAVVDRWRAGRESGKQNLKLIRGVQEFCDVALDVIFYIKEHGLLGAEEQQQQQQGEMEEKQGEEEEEVKKKGKGKGKAVDKEDGVAVLKAKSKGKRAAAATEKVETGTRKKGKVAVKKEEPKKRGRKSAGITVVKR